MYLFTYCATVLLINITRSAQCLVHPWIEVPLLIVGTCNYHWGFTPVKTVAQYHYISSWQATAWNVIQWILRAVGNGKSIVGGEAIALLHQYGTGTEAEMANICANYCVARSKMGYVLNSYVQYSLTANTMVQRPITSNQQVQTMAKSHSILLRWKWGTSSWNFSTRKISLLT